MNDEIITIYSAVSLNHKESIPKTAKEAYLNCKFWKATKGEAIKFSQVYRGPVRFEAFRTIALLNNVVLDQQNIQSLNINTAWLLSSGCKLSNHIFMMSAILHLNILHCLSQLWNDIHNDTSYPNEHLIDDILPWAASKNLIDSEKTMALEKEILAARCCIFSNINVEDCLRIKTVQMFINSNGYIFYRDAIELLLLNENILPELKTAVNTGAIIACLSKDKQNYYLHMLDFGHFCLAS